MVEVVLILMIFEVVHTVHSLVLGVRCRPWTGTDELSTYCALCLDWFGFTIFVWWSNIWIKTYSSVYDSESVIEPCSSVSANSNLRIQRTRDDPELTLLSIRAINTTCKSDRNMDIAGNGVDALDPRIQVIIIELLFQSLIRIAIDLGCL